MRSYIAPGRGGFKPGEIVTRAELGFSLARVLALEESEGLSSYTDVDQGGSYGGTGVSVHRLGVIEGTRRRFGSAAFVAGRPAVLSYPVLSQGMFGPARLAA